MITGRDGRTLREKWRDEGVRTFLGLHSHGFPNLFIMSGPQGGGGSSTSPRGLESHTDYVVWMLETMRARGATRRRRAQGARGRVRGSTAARPTS